MAGAVRRALAAAGLTIVAMAVSAPSSLAAVAPSMSSPAVASVQPVNGQRVGVAHPIIVTFTKPVLDRVAAERSVSVTASASCTGKRKNFTTKPCSPRSCVSCATSSPSLIW